MARSSWHSFRCNLVCGLYRDDKVTIYLQYDSRDRLTRMQMEMKPYQSLPIAPIDLEHYFERIGYAGPRAAGLAVLEQLHALHPAAIPFENLSPFLGETVKLDLPSLEEKLVRGARGGWCFEQNLLFSYVLLAMGFNVTRLAARVRWNVPAGVITARSHMLMLVRLEGADYIADVGFGGLTLTAPLRLAPGVEQETPLEPHRISALDAGFMLEAKIADEWQAMYTFDLAEQQLADYEVSNWYLCNHPGSQFVTGIIAARTDSNRRYALRNTRFAIHYANGETERRFLTRVDEYRRTLEETFRIRLPDAPDLDARIARMIAANPSA
jgi:N-hydroxyarylamine O-acetyltransferase